MQTTPTVCRGGCMAVTWITPWSNKKKKSYLQGCCMLFCYRTAWKESDIHVFCLPNLCRHCCRFCTASILQVWNHSHRLHTFFCVCWCVVMKVCGMLQDWLYSPGHLPSEIEAGRIPDHTACTVQGVLQLLQTLYAIMEQSTPSSYRNGQSALLACLCACVSVCVCQSLCLSHFPWFISCLWDLPPSYLYFSFSCCTYIYIDLYFCTIGLLDLNFFQEAMPDVDKKCFTRYAVWHILGDKNQLLLCLSSVYIDFLLFSMSLFPP